MTPSDQATPTVSTPAKRRADAGGRKVAVGQHQQCDGGETEAKQQHGQDIAAVLIVKVGERGKPAETEGGQQREDDAGVKEAWWCGWHGGGVK